MKRAQPDDRPHSRQQALAEFATHALRGHDMDQLLHEACSQVAAGLGVPIAKIASRAEGSDRLILRAAVGIPESLGAPGETELPGGTGSAIGYAMQVADVVISDVEHETRFEPSDLIKRCGVKTSANVVLWVDGAPYGGLEADTTEPWRPSDEDINFMRTYATVVSAAIERSLLTGRIETLAREREFLLREIFHRIRNLFAVVLSIFRRTVRYTSKPEDLPAAFEERIAALSRAHDLLLAGPTQPARLRALIELEFNAKSLKDPARFGFEGPDVVCGPRAIQALALAIAELGTNAMKHGALSRGAPPTAGVRLSWRVEPGARGDEVVLVWRERGLAAKPELVRRGFGSELLERLVPQMVGGTARYTVHEDGIEWEVRFPSAEEAPEFPAPLEPVGE